MIRSLFPVFTGIGMLSVACIILFVLACAVTGIHSKYQERVAKKRAEDEKVRLQFEAIVGAFSDLLKYCASNTDNSISATLYTDSEEIIRLFDMLGDKEANE